MLHLHYSHFTILSNILLSNANFGLKRLKQPYLLLYRCSKCSKVTSDADNAFNNNQMFSHFKLDHCNFIFVLSQVQAFSKSCRRSQCFSWAFCYLLWAEFIVNHKLFIFVYCKSQILYCSWCTQETFLVGHTQDLTNLSLQQEGCIGMLRAAFRDTKTPWGIRFQYP